MRRGATAPEPEDTPKAGWTPLLEVREVTPTDFLKGVFTDCVWVRSAGLARRDDPLMQRAGLTYLSDLGTGFGQQHRSLIGRGGPSIDHSLWFHEDIRADDWVLVDLRPVKARSARGTYHGSLRDRQGVLGATLYQEQLLLPGSMSDADEAPVTGKVAHGRPRRAGRLRRGAAGALGASSRSLGPQRQSNGVARGKGDRPPRREQDPGQTKGAVLSGS